MKLLGKHFTSLIRKVIRSRYTLFFINGFILACLLYFYMEDNYERQLFKAMAGYINESPSVSNNPEEDVLLKSLHLTNYLGKSRSFIYSNKDLQGLKSSFIHPVTVDLQTANGACGSYAYILSRILSELNITNRIAQMKVNGLYAGHNLVEAKTAKGWVVLDGTYDLYFNKPDSSFASFADVQKNWDFYKKQVPADYNFSYAYEGVRYTNWDKIPVVMPLLKKVLTLFVGKEEIEGFSLRTFFLRKYNVLFQIALIIYLTLVLVIIRRFFVKNPKFFSIRLSDLFPDKLIPPALSGDSNRA